MSELTVSPTDYSKAIFSVADIHRQVFPEKPMIIPGILPAGAAVLLHAREKAGKGHLLVYMGYCVSNGVPCFGQPITLPGAVLYLAFEESPRVIQERTDRIFRGGDAPFHVMFLDGSTDARFQLESPGNNLGLMETIRNLDPVLVIADPLREMHSGAENDADDMAWRIRLIRQIAHNLDVTVLVSHHQSKGSGSFRGSTSILAAFDDQISFTRTDEAGEQAIKGILRAEGRNLPKKTMHVDFDPDTGHWRVGSQPEAMPDPALRDRILNTLEHTGDWLTAQDLDALLPGAALRSVQNTLTEMRKENPLPFAESGNGTRSNPRRFHALAYSLEIEEPSEGEFDLTQDLRGHTLGTATRSGIPVGFVEI